MKKVIGMLLTVLAIVTLYTTYVNAGNVTIKTANSNVTIGQEVSVIVSFGEKVSIAQFKLSYDKSKLNYEICSIGEFGTNTNTYVYVNSQDENAVDSVTLKFKAKAAGSATFAISGVVLSGDASISNATAKVVIKNANSGTTSVSKPTVTKPTSSNEPEEPKELEEPGENQEENPTLEVIEKEELNDIKSIWVGLYKDDYTEESWNKLQDIILNAQNATTLEEYEAVKDELDINSLKKVSFDKKELKKVLVDLLDKSKADYTEESWNGLKELIKKADATDLKSEYDAIKDKLTVNELVLVEHYTFERFLEDNKITIMVVLLSINVILIILSICIIIKARKRY